MLGRFWILMLLLALIVVGTYLANPSGTASLDPRARLMGFALYEIPSESMSPTLQTDDFIVVKTFAYFRRTPTVGDVVAYKPPHQDIPFVGRVMGVEGDRVSVVNSIVHLNGEALTETYIAIPGTNCPLADFKEVIIPDFSLFILGDNRCNSFDSRHFAGWVFADRIIGQAVYIWKARNDSRIGKIQSLNPHNRLPDTSPTIDSTRE